MGLFDAFIKEVAGSAGMDSPEQQGMMSSVMDVINSPQVGGLTGLMKNFEKAGLGQVAQSWVGTGANLQATPRQIQQGLGTDLVGSIAQKMGLSPAMASMALSVLLPLIVDKLTPKGQMPPPQQGADLGALLKGLGGLGGLLGGR
jgi:uncharacterized protein YidB (DUF937 family)